MKAKLACTNTQAPRSLLHTTKLNFITCLRLVNVATWGSPIGVRPADRIIVASSEDKPSLSERIGSDVAILMLREVLALARGIIIILFVI